MSFGPKRAATTRPATDDALALRHWTAISANGGTATISLDHAQPLNAALDSSLKLDASGLGPNQRAGIANDGYWGIPVRPNTTYRASLYAKANAFNGPLTVSIESADGTTVLATRGDRPGHQ